MAQPNADHVILSSKRERCFLCEHCGESEELSLPVNATDLILLIDEFMNEHRNCKKGCPHGF